LRIPFWTPEQLRRDPALVAAIEQRRGGQLLNLDRMLLWSEPLARSWNVFLKTLRQELSLSPKLRELAICVVARATGADYEFQHHAPEFERAGGSVAQVTALADPDAAADSPIFDPLEQDVIRYALASTREVSIPDELSAALALRLKRLDAIREAGVRLFERPLLGRDVFGRGDPQPIAEIKRPEWSATLYDLLSAYAAERQRRALARVRLARRTVWSLAEARAVLEQMIGVSGEWSCLDEFLIAYAVEPALRTTVLASSLAASLELVREGALEVHQSAAFAPKTPASSSTTAPTVDAR